MNNLYAASNFISYITMPYKYRVNLYLKEFHSNEWTHSNKGLPISGMQSRIPPPYAIPMNTTVHENYSCHVFNATYLKQNIYRYYTC